ARSVPDGPLPVGETATRMNAAPPHAVLRTDLSAQLAGDDEIIHQLFTPEHTPRPLEVYRPPTCLEAIQFTLESDSTALNQTRRLFIWWRMIFPKTGSHFSGSRPRAERSDISNDRRCLHSYFTY